MFDRPDWSSLVLITLEETGECVIGKCSYRRQSDSWKVIPDQTAHPENLGLFLSSTNIYSEVMSSIHIRNCFRHHNGGLC